MLPLLQLAGYIALVWYGCWYRPTWQHWMSPSSDPTGFYPNWIDGIEPFAEQLAAGINFPAVVVAALSLLPFDNRLHTGASSELALHVVTAIYVPLLWFLIGKRLDERPGTGAAPLSKSMKAFTITATVALLVAGSWMVWSFGEGQRYTLYGLSFLWIIGGIIALGSRLRR